VTEKPRHDRKDDISPELLWNALGMFQQLIMFTLMLIVYVVISLIVSRSLTPHEGLSAWMNSLQSLFVSKHIVKDLALGAGAGVAAVLVTTVLDTLIAIISRADLKEWFHRTDYLLPETKKQKQWAWIISLSGSIQEEIMFRGFILMAILPLWSHWLWAALILSAFFSLLHAGVQGFWSTFWIFLISVFLCALIALGASIYVVMTAHIMINVFNLFVVPRFFHKEMKK
jgi:membrane protease YdiL (CAAX protease family)